MPELPEVETVRRGLQPVMEGAEIVAVEQRRADLRFPFPEDFAARLTGRRIVSLARRAKYLLAHLDNGLILVSHLGMSGSFRIELPDHDRSPGRFHHPRSRVQAHDHVVFHLRMPARPPTRVVFNDPRRFGFMLLLAAEALEKHPLFARLGLEPTGNEFGAARLADLMRARRTSLKAALLDQRLIAGLGNIYVSEALWRARLSPLRGASSIAVSRGGTGRRAERLAAAIRSTISEAIEAGGSTLRDHRQADGSLGYFQHAFAVYGREGLSCLRADCNGTIRRILQSGRSTFYCPACQR